FGNPRRDGARRRALWPVAFRQFRPARSLVCGTRVEKSSRQRRAQPAFSVLNEQSGWTAGAIALAWVLANPHVSCAVFGTTRLPHLLAAVEASGRNLDSRLIVRIGQAAAMPA